jgi:hypothetical protein
MWERAWGIECAAIYGRGLAADFKIKNVMDRKLQMKHLAGMKKDRLQSRPPNIC